MCLPVFQCKWAYIYGFIEELALHDSIDSMS